MRSICVSLLLVMAICGPAEGKGPVKHKKKTAKTNFKLIEAYSQRTLSGVKSPAPPPTDAHFIIQWLGASYPETFFWRGENGFLLCSIDKAHKINPKDARKYPPGMEYLKENVTGDQIHKGDTLELVPLTRGKYPVPADIPQKAKNTLFYKTAGSGWLSFPVKTIVKKHDISMP